jgi:PAS domain S-box-containing protein
MTAAGSLFSEPTDPALAALIVRNAVEYAIFTMDQQGQITSWSPGAQRIFGYSATEALGQNSAMLFTESDRAAGSDELELRKALQTGRAEDSRWHLAQGGRRFWGNGVCMRCDGNGGTALLKILRDETPSKLAEEQRVLLLNELNHRVKNTLATVQSIAEHTLRSGQVDAQTRHTLAQRLIALSDAHDVLVRENWAGADLRSIIDGVIAAHQNQEQSRFRLDGPPVRLSPQQAVSVSLVLHELTTNALKHGALTVATGFAVIAWNIAQDGSGRRYMTLLWKEAGGPKVAPPKKSGFGTRLIERSFEADQGGRARLTYDAAGLQCSIDLQLSSPDEIPMA